MKSILTAGSSPAMPAYAKACGITVRPTVTPATKSPTASWLEYLWKITYYNFQFPNLKCFHEINGFAVILMIWIASSAYFGNQLQIGNRLSSTFLRHILFTFIWIHGAIDSKSQQVERSSSFVTETKEQSYILWLWQTSKLIFMTVLIDVWFGVWDVLWTC